tara:strand:- start:16226 stop:16579 length:354 start_codon:yes stop_codon:yes gene_type:complete
MNPPNPDSDNDPKLRETLQSWDVEMTAPPGFRREVWQRIAVRSEPKAFWVRHFQSFGEFFAHPVVAGGVALLVIGVAVASARVHSGIAAQQRMHELSEQYVVSIDPLLRSHFHPEKP